MKENVPVWKDTRLEYSVDYDYSLFVRNRCIFFYGEAAHFRKTLNYAAKFCKPWNICVVYLYGQISGGMTALRKYVAKYPKNVIAYCFSEITKAHLDAIEKYRAWRNAGISRGDLLQSGDFTELYKEGREKILRAVNKGSLPSNDILYCKYLEDNDILQAYEDAMRKIREIQFRPAECAANCINADVLSPLEDGLMEAICMIYPYGVESDTEEESYVKMASINRHIRSALNGKTEMGIVFEDSERQISIFDRFTEGASRIVSLIRQYCAGRIERDGRFYIAEIWSIIEAPPYGAYDCNWYMYLFAYGLAPYYKDPYHSMILYTARPSSDVNAVFAIKGKIGCIFELSESQIMFTHALSELFGCRDSVYVTEVLQDARSWCESNVQTPLAWIDDRFLDLLDFDCDKWTKRETVNAHEWILLELTNLKRRIETVDTDFDHAAIECGADPNRVKLFRKWSYMKGGAVGWLHSKEMFQERFDSYMKKDCVCRECGRTIERYEDYITEEITTSGNPTRYHHKALTFTKRDVVGLNKKLLGRCQYEFFCIPCLCTVLDTDSETLFQKKEQFREQGCQLF